MGIGMPNASVIRSGNRESDVEGCVLFWHKLFRSDSAHRPRNTPPVKDFLGKR